MATPPIYREPLDGTEMVRVLKDGRYYMAPIMAVAALATVQAAPLAAALATALAPVLARLAALEAAEAGQAARDTAQDAALSLEMAGRQAADAAEVIARQAVAAAISAEAMARQATDAAQAARIAALEGRPEEVAHFTASAKLPTIAVGTPVILTLTGLVPAVAGDTIKAGEQVQVERPASLPAGVNIAGATVPANGTVALQLTASLLIAAGAAPIVWNITVLR